MAGPYATDDLRNYVAFGKQSVFGTAVPPTVFVPFTGDITPDHNMAGDDVYEGGTGPYVARSVKTKQKPAGQITMPVKPQTFGKLAAWFLGADSSAAAGSLFDHTSTPSQAPVYLTCEWDQADELVERLAGTVLTKLVLSSPVANGEVTAQWSFAGAVPTVQASPTTATYETGMHGVSPGAAWRPSDCAYLLDNAAITNVSGYDITVDWGVDEDVYTSSYLRAAFLKLKMTVEVKLRILELDVTRYKTVNYGGAAATATIADFFDGVPSAFKASYTNGLTSTNLRNTSIDIPQIMWKSAPRKLQAAGGVSVIELVGQARKPAGAIVTVISRTADSAAY
jgi:hypothetical protein